MTINNTPIKLRRAHWDFFRSLRTTDEVRCNTKNYKINFEWKGNLLSVMIYDTDGTHMDHEVYREDRIGKWYISATGRTALRELWNETKAKKS